MRALQDGYREVARIRGIPIRLHWTVPLGALLPASFIGFKLLQSIYLCIGYLMLVGLHEAGHAIAAKTLKLDVIRVDITGLGGMCWVENARSLRSGLWLYSGGLIAQALLLVATAILVALAGRPSSLFLNCLVFMFTAFNLLVFVVNVIPLRSTGHSSDGFVLWKIIGEIRRQRT